MSYKEENCNNNREKYERFYFTNNWRCVTNSNEKGGVSYDLRAYMYRIQKIRGKRKIITIDVTGFPRWKITLY